MPIAKLPAFFNMTYTDKDGNLTPNAHMFNDQTFQSLNNLILIFNQMASTLFNNDPGLTAVSITPPSLLGINPPAFTTAQIAAILAYNPPAPLTPVPEGTIWYNKDIGKLQFKNGSGIQTITSTP